MPENEQQINVIKKDGYLFATLPAYESLGKTRSLISALCDAVDQHQARKLLIDCTPTQKRIPIVEFYELCIYLVSKFGPLRPKMAVIASPEAAYPDRFGETVIRNRGLDLIRFVNHEEEALDWLLERRPGSAPPGTGSLK